MKKIILLCLLLAGCSPKYLCAYKDNVEVYATASDIVAESEKDAEKVMQYIIDHSMMVYGVKRPVNAKISCMRAP